MLNALRSSVRSIFFKILFAILIVSFAIWGIGDIFRGGGARPVAEVGDFEITAPTLVTAYRNRTRQLGIDVTPEQARSLGLIDGVLEGLIAQALYNAEARSIGMSVPDDVVLQRIHSEPAFRNEAGRFDPFVFERVLAINNLSEQQYVAGLREEILREQLLTSIAIGVRPPPVLAERLYRWREEQRVAEVILIPFAAEADVGAPDEVALTQYYEANAQEFTAPEYRGVTFVHLRPADLVGEFDVGEERLKEAYAHRQAEFAVPERRTVRQMVIEDRAVAEAAVERLRGGADFMEVAKEIAQQDELATELGTVTRADLPDELADPVFALQQGQVSDPVEGPFGWHVFQIADIQAGALEPFEAVRDRLKQQLAEDAAIGALYDLANKLDDALGGGATIEEAAAQIDFPVQRVEAVDRGGRGRDGQPVEVLPKGSRFLETLYQTPVGEDSLLTETEAGGYFVLRVDEAIPPTLRPFAEVRDQVEEAWTRERREEATLHRAESVLAHIREGQAPGAVAMETGLEIQDSAPFRRDGRGAGGGMPNALVPDMFAASVGEAALTQRPDGAVVVAVLKEVRAADPSASPTALAETRSRLLDGQQSDVLVQFNSALRHRFSVSVDRAAVDSLLAEGRF